MILSKGKIKGIIDKDILVCKKTTPKMIEKIMQSKAVFVEEGGLLSHASIICRELKIPCVRIDNATKIFKKGTEIVGLNWIYGEVLNEINKLVKKYANPDFKVNGEPLEKIGKIMIEKIQDIKMDKDWYNQVKQPIDLFRTAKDNSQRMIAISWMDKIVRASNL